MNYEHWASGCYGWKAEVRVAKDQAIRAKHEQRLAADLDKLAKRIADGRLVKPQKIGEAIGRLKERYPRVANTMISATIL